ncbi:PKD domain-containing protein, partial [bacterium]|nr:PKD domain-containing protein [bacterium]
MQYKNKKNLYKILFITILLGFIISLAGCDWLSLGIINIFDPQAQIRVNYTGMNLEEGTIALEVYSLNEVEFIGSGFAYEYYVGNTKIPGLSKTVGATFYVAQSTSPGTPGPITTIDLLLYYQEVQDYITSNPLITELTCTISLIGTDGAGHSISKSVTVDLPAIQPGIDFEPPVAVISVDPGTTGTAPFTVIFDAYESTDNRGIASYAWDFGDGTTATGVMPAAHIYTGCGSYVVKLTVTDHWGLKGYAMVIINVSETGGPKVVIKVTPGTTGTVPFTVYFDASGCIFETGCGVGTATYSWNFGDGSPAETGVTTSHTYNSNGVYTVILKVTDSAGNVGYGSVIITVELVGEVNAVIKITPESASGTEPFTVGLDASESTTSVTGATIVKYTWNFNDGSAVEVHNETPPIPVTTHTYLTDGTYLVQLTVEDS